ncbi:hypothetical protein H0H81_010069, partial [Sphagnurus paluster]
HIFYDKKIAQEVPGDEWNGYFFRITSGNDKQGFSMKQGVLLALPLLLTDVHSCYRTRRTSKRKRKSVRRCIVGPDITVLSLVIVCVCQGEAEIPGLTDNVLPKRLGLKRAAKIRSFFNLAKDDVRKHVVRCEVESRKKEGAKPYTKA